MKIILSEAEIREAINLYLSSKNLQAREGAVLNKVSNPTWDAWEKRNADTYEIEVEAKRSRGYENS